ncbi:calmodulin-binding protein, partial [Trifolium medium]|nr:calmodulin-binding protein [Trifolium medium]
MNNLPQRNYTDSKIEAEGGEPLRIELRDAENQHIVRGEGSSMKIQICVLHGDFEKEEDWTAEEFDKQIVIPREGKGPLLKGDKIITLKDGVAYINNVEFTDIIKGRTKQVRLGAKIVRPNSIGLDIREGRSEPFRVLHRRVKAYKKHDRPSMNDEVSRLRGIGGKLCDKLASRGIVSVKDFLQLYKTNEASLREKIGKIAEKSWNKIIAHVKECDVDDDDEEEERVKQHAYKNLNGLKQIAIDTTTHGLVETSSTSTSTGVQTAQYGGQDQTLQ